MPYIKTVNMFPLLNPKRNHIFPFCHNYYWVINIIEVKPNPNMSLKTYTDTDCTLQGMLRIHLFPVIAIKTSKNTHNLESNIQNEK